MDAILGRTLDQVEVGEPASFLNLSLFPLSGPGLDDPGYLTLDEAMEQGVVEIAEVSKAGSVPELQVSNTGALAVLLLDGEELVGARQNRVLNQSHWGSAPHPGSVARGGPTPRAAPSRAAPCAASPVVPEPEDPRLLTARRA